MKTIYTTILAFIIILITGVFSILNAQQHNGLNFDGIDDYASVPSASAAIVAGTGMSMSCWVYPTNTSSGWPNYDGICGFRNDSNADFYLLQLSSTTIEARFRNSTGTDYTMSYTGFQLNTWQHYVLTFNGTTLSLYKDNALIQSIPASGSIISSSETFYIGRFPFQSNYFQYKGTIDEVCLWDKALTTTEISALYTCGNQLAINNLKFQFSFNQGNASANNAGLTTAINSAGTINASLHNFALSGASSNWVTGKAIGNFNITSTTVCQGDSLLYNGQYVSVAGNYYDTIAVPGSCDSINVFTLIVTPGFYDTTYTKVCDGESVLFHGNTYTLAGNYDAAYSGAQCDSIYTLVLTLDPKPSAFAITGSTTVIAQSVESYSAPITANVSYTWFVSGGVIISQTTNNAVDIRWGPTGMAFVKAIAKNQNNCYSDTVTLSFLIGVDGIENSASRSISIFPNPVKEVLSIDCDDSFTGKIFDSSARLILNFNTNKVNVSKFEKGIYILMIEFEDGSRAHKQIIIE